MLDQHVYCSGNGCPSIPVRMMAGLTFLKYMFGLSCQDVLDNWCENPYWQHFCGGELGDKLNAMLSAVGFNLVKLMKGLKKKWLRSLFLCLREVTDGMARIIAGLRDCFMPPTAPVRLPSCGEACRLPQFGNWGFA